MAYQKPIVLVYQEFERISPSLGNPDLAGCIIGPAYQILTLADDKSIIRAGFTEYDFNFNVTVPRKTASFSDSVELAVTSSDVPHYILTFNEVADFESQYDIVPGDTSAVTPSNGQNDQHLTLTYGTATTTPSQEIRLDGKDLTGANTYASVKIADVKVTPSLLADSGYDDGTGVLTHPTINFETSGVGVGDIVVLLATGSAAATTDQARALGTVTAVSGLTVTVGTGEFIKAIGGNLGTIADFSLATADEYKLGYLYVYSDDATESAANSIILQVQDVDSVSQFGVIDPNDVGGAFYGTANSFGTEFQGGNHVIWDNSVTTHDPVTFSIPNPDSTPGLELVTASTKVYFDDAVAVVAGGIGRVQGALTFTAPTDVLTGTFSDNLTEVTLDSTTALTAVTADPSAADATIAVTSTVGFEAGGYYLIKDGSLEERIIVTAVTDSTNLAIDNADGLGAGLDNAYTSASLYSDGFDTLTHTDINFEALSVLPGDTFYLEFSNGTGYAYEISAVDGKSLTLTDFDEATPGVFTGIVRADGTPYSVSLSEEADLFGPTGDAVTGFFSVYRGQWSSLAITTAAADSLVDADEDELLSFNVDGTVDVSTLGFLASHINIEVGDDVFISTATTGQFNTLNATYVKHRVFDVQRDRLLLTSPINVPTLDRATDITPSTINDAVSFYVMKRGVDDMLLPITGYDEDADAFTVTISNASALIDPRYSALIPGFGGIPAEGTYLSIDDVGTVVELTIKGFLVEGITYVGSKSLRTDLSEQLLTIFNTNEIEGTLGKITPENPLAYGVFKCLQNTITFCNAYAIDEGTSGTTAEEVAYQKALDFISDKRVYGLVPLTRSTGILGAFKQHVDQVSTPEKGLWRIAMVNQELQTSSKILDKHGATSSLLTNVTIRDLGVVDHRRFVDSTASFVSDGISAGMNLELFYDVTDNSRAAQKYIVDAVNSETIITVTESIVDENGDAYTAGDQVIGNMNYEITRDLSKTEQAQTIATVSQSFGTRRIISVWPDVIEVSGAEIPGYYLGAVLAGMISGLPAHQGFTRLGIAGVDSLVNSNTYFNDTQLDIIAGGGTYIFVQDAPGALPYCRHQLTTDRSFVEVAELNVVKNFDFMSYFFKDLLEPFIGQWNVTDEAVAAIQRSIRSGIAFQEARRYPKIGAALRPGKTSIRSIVESEISSDRIEVVIDLALPRPLNIIGLHLVV